MIIVSSKPGRLGNLLIVYASLLAWSLERNIRVVNPAFSRYRHYFKRRSKSREVFEQALYRICYFNARIIDRLKISNPLFAARHLDWKEAVDLGSGDRPMTASLFYFVQGWQYRAGGLVQKHAAALRRQFTPLPMYLKQLDEFWQSHIAPGSLVIGIHMRRGDYQRFEGGAHYFQYPDYEAVMLSLQHHFGTEQVSFLLCSDEKVNRSVFRDPGLKIIPGPAHELLDMYALARCNYIAAPPSTYSMWASFYGQVPLYMIRDPRQPITKLDFKVQESF